MAATSKTRPAVGRSATRPRTHRPKAKVASMARTASSVRPPVATSGDTVMARVAPGPRREASRTDTTIRAPATTPVSRPSASSSPASHASAGADIPASALTVRAEEASWFITTTIQWPRCPSQVSDRVPVPWVFAAQRSAVAGAAGAPVPG